MGKLTVVGHRGAKFFYPENTMLSFEKAIEMGVDGIETDIRMSQDGVLMLMHDPSLARTTNVEVGGICDYTYAELKKIDAGCKFAPEFAGCQIPTLQELLELCQGKNLFLNLEIKEFRKEVVDATLKLMQQMNMGDDFVIASFSPMITTYAQKVCGVKTQGFPRRHYENFTEDIYDGMYAVGIGMKDLSRELVEEYRQIGIQPWCWCPDTPEAITQAVEATSPLATVNNPLPALEYNKQFN